MDERGANSTATKLLTLLNVSASRLGKRKHLLDEVNLSVKLNKRKGSVTFVEEQKEKENVSPQVSNDKAGTFDLDEAKIDEDGLSTKCSLSANHSFVIFFQLL